MKTSIKLYVADFETTVYEGQTDTEVWAAGLCELYSENAIIYNNIDDYMNFFLKKKGNYRCWFHNVKFDGSFILSWLLNHGYKYDNRPTYQMSFKSFKCLISSKRRYYSITIKGKYSTLELLDSAKLIPFSLADAAKAFNTKHQKSTMEYTGYRKAGGYIKPEERVYLLGDVLVLKELIEILISMQMEGLTIGSVCMKEFKSFFEKFEYNALFPDLRNVLCEVNNNINSEQYIRQFYRGAWCYLKEAGVYQGGVTYDANSLYSSQMHSKSGNYYPVGFPHYFKNHLPDVCEREDIVYFIHLKAKFKIKEGYVPTIQIKRDPLYASNEWLKTSDFYLHGEYLSYILDENGDRKEAYPELYLTQTDYELFLEHYDITDLQIIDGAWFTGMKYLFDEYIDKWFTIKSTTKDKVMRTLAKLYLNNLYGKFATDDDGSYLEPKLDQEGIMYYELHTAKKDKVHYIPIGCMTTAYSRYCTIKKAQLNYDVFIYADTDSLHCLNNKEIIGIDIHDSNLCCWKQEGKWEIGKFIRQKTYIEKEGGKYNVVCAGMPEKCKTAFLNTKSLESPIERFRYGLEVEGKLIPKLIKGGTILKESTFKLRKKY